MTEVIAYELALRSMRHPQLPAEACTDRVQFLAVGSSSAGGGAA